MVAAGCRQPYMPPAVTTDYNFLVVDGFINTSPNSVTTITLSRTRSLADTIFNKPENNARVIVESESGVSYNLSDQGSGVYRSMLNLNPGIRYRLKITSVNGIEYASEFVTPKQAPLIDSLFWKQDRDVTVYIAAHDPQNNTHYYRWDYEETWEYHAHYDGIWGLRADTVFVRDASTQAFKCWSTARSNNIILGNTLNLSQDIVARAPVAFIPQNSEKIGVRYSILVSQYALTKEAYEYWQILQKNTQQIGTLFDAQPSQLKGNIHNLNNPNETVIGFMSASSVEQKRIFITYAEVTNWNTESPPGYDCTPLLIPYNSNDFPHFTYQDTSYAPYYFVTGGAYVVVKPCLDCTRRGGVNQKPSFW